MEQKELDAVLEAHLKWLRNKDGGIRADLYGADLSEANLRGAYLYGMAFLLSLARRQDRSSGTRKPITEMEELAHR